MKLYEKWRKHRVKLVDEKSAREQVIPIATGKPHFQRTIEDEKVSNGATGKLLIRAVWASCKESRKIGKDETERVTREDPEESRKVTGRVASEEEEQPANNKQELPFEEAEEFLRKEAERLADRFR